MKSDSFETLTFGAVPAPISDPDVSGLSARPLWPAVRRGLFCRCPQCGEGRIFDGYLATHDHCAVCGQEFSGHRADDLPPYLTVFIVGHLIVALFLAADEMVTLSMWTHLAIFVPLTILISLALLRPLKGATIGLQWSMRMHGFGDAGAAADH